MESAAKVAKLDEDGATIDNFSFGSPLTEEASQIANNLQTASKKSKLLCQDDNSLDDITLKLEELCTITYSSTQTNEVNPEMTESSIQTEELDYMVAKICWKMRRYFFTLDCLQLLFYKLYMNM